MQAQIEQKRIKAPFDGVLGVRRVNLGQFARAGDPLVSLTNTSTMYANLTLPEQALGALRPGQSVRVTVDAHPGRAFTGKVTTIEPQVDPGTHCARAGHAGQRRRRARRRHVRAGTGQPARAARRDHRARDGRQLLRLRQFRSMW